jgi:hypothetical protein
MSLSEDRTIAPEIQQAQIVRSQHGLALAPILPMLFVGGVCCGLSVLYAGKTVAAWLNGTQYHSVDGIDQILSIFVTLFISVCGVLSFIFIREQMIDRPSGHPVRGQSLLVFAMILCGASGCLSVLGILVSWFGVSGGDS